MRRPTKLFQHALLIGMAMLMVSSGCRRKTPAPPAGTLGEETPPASEPAAPVPDRLPTAPNDSSLRLPIHQELTGAIHLYQMDHQKMPPDFDTLVRAKYLKAMPKPPPGKRFALDRNQMQVVITD